MRGGLLDGKSVVITGAGSGVGRASALLFASEGAHVVVADRRRDWADEAALYLASDMSANVTGVALPVDGGYVAK